ncbi:MAG TPA: HAD hydrolase-like protein [Caulobacteraceae bacterium]|nr:HAD hydrolase-like protein [Caulobacteraceae bacterium]
MRYRLVIFDFDGTLADSFPWVIGMMNDVADKFAFRRVRDGELEALRLCDAREIMRRLGVKRWKLPMIARYVRARMAAEVDQIPLFPGAGQMLADLAAAGVKMAVVSANGEDTIRKVLGPDAALIDGFAAGVSLFGKRSKLVKMAKLTGVERSQAIVIGDELRDLDAARAAGMAFGAVSWGATRASAHAERGADFIFEQMDQIKDAVLGG